jgi:diguanylate cyclase (GGDEF)-like protein
MDQALLFVDDEPNILQSLRRIFEDERYIIYTATSGKDALEILVKIPIQVIVSDQRMPNMNGAEFLTQVKKLYPNTVRIILSGFSDFNALRDAINNGAIYKFINKPWDINALKALVRDAFQQITPIADDADILKLANKDPLTKLSNRLLFNKRLEDLIISAREKKQSIVIILLFLDGFNKVDEIFGEINADNVLQLMAKRLQKLGEEDADIASLGRGKFCLLFENILKNNLENLLNKVVAEIKKPVKLLSREYVLSSTIGISLFPEHGDTYYSLMKHAEYARSLSAKQGANTYQIYNERMVSKERELISELDILSALEKEEFIIYYQPIVSAKTYKIVGAEALVRWIHPKHGLLSPDAFIPLCEETGLIIELGAFVLQQACMQLKKWHDINNKLFMSVNISPRQLRDSALIGLLQNTLSSADIPPESLELELTENVMMYDTAFHIDIMQKIAGLGIKLSIDDFGTGFSSLTYLKLLPITKLKIDKSFISDIDKNKINNDIIRVIIALAKTLGLALVAEGVETNEQLASLKRKKCDQIQGFIFSKPIVPEDFSPLLEANKPMSPK